MKKGIKKVDEKIDTTELITAMEELEKERGIKKEILLDSIQNALITAYKRNFDVITDNVKVVIDDKTGETHVYAEYEVVEEVEDSNSQISLKDAQNIDPKFVIGDTVSKELIPRNFGRIAAQTAKQVIIQRIREASRDIIYNEFNEKKGEIVSGIIQRVEPSMIIVDLGKIEAIMPYKEQIPTEKYSVNQKIRACIIDVEKGIKGNPQIIVSRASNEFVRRLFELEIPEIYEKVIEIKSISRDTGKRSKVAVFSPNENIDPVGSCVGQKGIRIQNIINELNGEKIDVIEWNADPATYIAESLLPAKVLAVDTKEEERFAQIIVPDDQLSLAIGKGGQNAKLAARLTGWKIDIKSETQFREMLQKKEEEKTETETKDLSKDITDIAENNEEPAKKTTAKKTAEKKESVKKTTVKKTAEKKAPAKKTTVKKTAEKKAPAKKSTTKKTVAKKTKE